MAMLADAVALVHIAYFVFVIGGFLAIVAGAQKKWPLVYNPRFRISHLLAVWIVLVEDLLQVECPLNILETSLRTGGVHRAEAAGGATEIVDMLLRHTLSETTLDVIYWTVGPVSLVLLWLVRPRFRRAAGNLRSAERRY